MLYCFMNNGWLGASFFLALLNAVLYTGRKHLSVGGSPESGRLGVIG